MTLITLVELFLATEQTEGRSQRNVPCSSGLQPFSRLVTGMDHKVMWCAWDF